MEEWRRDRLADLAKGEAELEAKGRQLYGEGIRSGQDLVARTTSEVRELAKRPAAVGTLAASPMTRGPSWAQQVLANARRLEGKAPEIAKVALRDGADRLVRMAAGDAARTAGNATGVITGAGHLGHNVLDSAVLAARLQHPVMDYLISPPGQSAVDQVAGIGKGMYEFGTKVATDPRRVGHDLAEKFGDLIRDTVPMATPEASTLEGEVRRQFHIGKRQGEVGVEIAPYFVGAGELKGLADLGALARANSVGKYAKMGFSEVKAARLAEPYSGMGDHAFIKRGAKMPGWLGGGPVPRWIVDSPFNVLKPPGISTGDMYELHYKVDPDMYGAKLPRGRPGWSGRRLGIRRYEGPARLWFRTPNATRQAIAGLGVPETTPFNGGEEE